ncbi:hypothetical protein CR513_56929, partial [Mucuna pruriens]
MRKMKRIFTNSLSRTSLNSSTLSLGYKELKRKFSKLTKDFESLEKENSILEKENEKLKEKQINDLSKVNTSKVTKLQKEVIHLRQSLDKFVNGIENLNKKFGCRSYDYKECPKESFKPSRTNPKGPKKIWSLCSKTSIQRKEDELPSEVIKKNNLYKINLAHLTNENITCLVSINDDQWMWHKKLGCYTLLPRIFKLK